MTGKAIVLNTVKHLLLVLGGIIMLLPFLWMVSTSLNIEGSLFYVGCIIMLIPFLIWVISCPDGQKKWVKYLIGFAILIPLIFWFILTAVNSGGLRNYSEAWNKVPFARYIFNTLFVTALVVLGVLVTSSLAAYSFATMKYRGRNMLFLLFLSTMMVPQPVYLAPSYVVLSKLGWIDTYAALIVPWVANVFTIFLLRQHFRTIPISLYEAAVLDGCSRLKYLWKVVLPLSKSVLVTVILFNIIGSWNSFMWPLVVTHSENLRVLQVGLSYFNQEQSSNYSLLMAASTFSTLPLIILFLFVQKRIVASYSRSGMKS